MERYSGHTIRDPIYEIIHVNGDNVEITYDDLYSRNNTIRAAKHYLSESVGIVDFSPQTGTVTINNPTQYLNAGVTDFDASGTSGELHDFNYNGSGLARWVGGEEPRNLSPTPIVMIDVADTYQRDLRDLVLCELSNYCFSVNDQEGRRILTNTIRKVLAHETAMYYIREYAINCHVFNNTSEEGMICDCEIENNNGNIFTLRIHYPTI